MRPFPRQGEKDHRPNGWSCRGPAGRTSAPGFFTGSARYAALPGNVERADVLPFLRMERFQWEELKLEYTLKDVPEPCPELTEQVRNIFRREETLKNAVH